MNVMRVCDVCKRPIVDFKDFRELQLVKRENWDCIIGEVWNYDLCMKCSLEIEQDIIRKIKIKDMRDRKRQ